MKRSSLDRLISTTGLIMAMVLIAASAALFYAHNFVHNQVRQQLISEKINFPAAGSPALTSLPAADQAQVSQYAGEPLLTGGQAEVFADHYIAVHLKKISGGKTYSELSAASITDPSNTELAGQVQTVFRGETLRGLLLNAYAFDTMGMVAYYAAIGALIGSILLLVLSMLGFSHASRASTRKR